MTDNGRFGALCVAQFSFLSAIAKPDATLRLYSHRESCTTLGEVENATCKIKTVLNIRTSLG